MHGFIIGAPASGQGKTTVTLGLIGALREAGRDVVSAKSGPDYIDPAFHQAASGKPSVTLDSWAASAALLRARAGSAPGDLLVVEGAMGLLDGAQGAAPGGAGSAQAVAEALGLGTILVIDASRMAQSAAAIVAGFRATGGPIDGVILNRVGSDRHERLLRRAIEPVCPVLGALPTRDDLATPSRHLGLVQASERKDLQEFLTRASGWVRAHCDLDLLLGLARPLERTGAELTPLRPLGQRIAVARDLACSFVYPHLLEDWRQQGAELAFFSPLANEPPDRQADAVYLPGGYPELHAGALAAASDFQEGLRHAAKQGTVIYGECGGYMLLGDGLVDQDGERHRMAGLLRLETSFAKRRRHLGYRALTSATGPLEGSYRGHEFHYATTLSAHGTPLFAAQDAEGASQPDMGLINGTVMGSFAHIIERA